MAINNVMSRFLYLSILSSRLSLLALKEGFINLGLLVYKLFTGV